jgi:3'-phosphoadenosine 5'-phosphosulfate sulfotransferase (PAPS reductase)/FAD synthetase
MNTEINIPEVEKEMPRLILTSGGETSAFLTYQFLLAGLRENDHIVFTNTGFEDPKTLEFLHKQEEYWGLPLRWLEYDPECENSFREVDYHTASVKGDPFKKMIEENAYLPNPKHRICTQKLKVETAQRFMKSFGYDEWQKVVGLRSDEPTRKSKLSKFDTDLEQLVLPLFYSNVDKSYIESFWEKQNFRLETDELLKNCNLCFLKGKGKILSIMSQYPEVANEWIGLENKVGRTFNKDHSLENLKILAENMLFPGEDIFSTDQLDVDCVCGGD